MLYLFGSGSYKNDRKVVKIGFTDDMDLRKKNYYLYNPLGVLLGTRDGDRILEAKMHLRLSSYKVEFLDEWFYDEPEVEKVFGSGIEEIDKWIWDNRTSSLLDPAWPKKGTIKYKILEELRSKYSGPSLGTKLF
jgi:hypothetical protein